MTGQQLDTCGSLTRGTGAGRGDGDGNQLRDARFACRGYGADRPDISRWCRSGPSQGNRHSTRGHV